MLITTKKTFALTLYVLLTLLNCSKDSTDEISLEDQLQQAIEQLIQEHDLNGISTSVIQSDGTIWSGVAGLSDPGNPVEQDMYFAIGSITKNFVAALILRFEELNLLRLEDSIGMYLPAYQHVNSSTTIQQLLSHNSGIADYTDNASFIASLFNNPTKKYEAEELIELIEAPLMEPGISFSYSNTNFILLGMILNVISGGDFSNQLKEKLLKPNGLTQFYMISEESIPGTLVHNWADIGNGQEDISDLPKTAIYSAAWTAGGMWATAEELAIWTRSLFTGELLEEASLIKMKDFLDVSDPRSPQLIGYGLGSMKFQTTPELIGHTGDIFGFGSISIYAPQDGITITALMNQNTDENIKLDIVTTLLAAAK